MPDIKLPDSSIARFPDSMTEEEIEAALARQFSPTVQPVVHPRRSKPTPNVEWAPEVIRRDERPFPDRRPPRVFLSRPRRKQ